jgi:MFS family permease
MTERQVGLLFSLNGAVVVLLQYWAAKILERMRLTAGLAAGCLFYAAGYAAVGFAGGMANAALGVAVLTLGEVLVSPGVHTLAANIAPEGRKGRFLGVLGILQQTGSALGIMLGGIGNQRLSAWWPPAPWCLVASLALACAFGFASLRRRLLSRENGQIEDAAIDALPPG